MNLELIFVGGILGLIFVMVIEIYKSWFFLKEKVIVLIVVVILVFLIIFLIFLMI